MINTKYTKIFLIFCSFAQATFDEEFTKIQNTGIFQPCFIHEKDLKAFVNVTSTMKYTLFAFVYPLSALICGARQETLSQRYAIAFHNANANSNANTNDRSTAIIPQPSISQETMLERHGTVIVQVRQLQGLDQHPSAAKALSVEAINRSNPTAWFQAVYAKARYEMESLLKNLEKDGFQKVCLEQVLKAINYELYYSDGLSKEIQKTLMSHAQMIGDKQGEGDIVETKSKTFEYALLNKVSQIWRKTSPANDKIGRKYDGSENHCLQGSCQLRLPAERRSYEPFEV